MGSVGPAELLILLMPLTCVAVAIVAIVDGARRPDWAWQQAGQSKVTWIVVQAVGTFACFVVGLMASIVYLTTIRPKLVLAQGAEG